MGASTEAENENGEKPADLIDPDCKDLLKLFEVGCVWPGTKWTHREKSNRQDGGRSSHLEATYLTVFNTKQTCDSVEEHGQS